MPIDVAAALGAHLPRVTTSWDADRIVLYHLGVGAAAGGIDERSLRLVWEDRLVVLPTFAVVAGSDAAIHATTHPSLGIDPAGLVQRSHAVHVHRPLPRRATVTSEARIEQLHDTGRSAVITVATDTFDDTGALLATNRFMLIARGAGGFGGEPPPVDAFARPSHPPIERLSCAIAPNLAALYRLSGDRTPLHIDPPTARAAGFTDVPLAGLCTLGIIGCRVVESMFAGDATCIAGMSGTFAAAVYPGETLLVDLWRAPDRVLFEARVAGRDIVAVRDGAIELA